MSIPTARQLGNVVYDVIAAETKVCLNTPQQHALTQKIATAVRDAVLEGAALEAEGVGGIPLCSMDMGETHVSIEAVADWLRSLKVGDGMQDTALGVAIGLAPVWHGTPE